MYATIKTCLLAAVAVISSAAPAVGVEELLAPLNAIPDHPVESHRLPSELLPGDVLQGEVLPGEPSETLLGDGLPGEAIPASPYDAVPFELDPAVPQMRQQRHYSQSPPLYDVAPAAPERVTDSIWPESMWAAPAWPALRWPFSQSTSTACCVPPKIRYWNHPLLAADVCPCGCEETIETHLPVPCQCCPVMVKVCVPVCCSGPPQCNTGRDLLGRKVYDYCWPNGYRVTVVDRHTGTLVVHTFNR
ncbi:hypothetical protein [Roseimaritima ulvae]|uniref:Uncharacterized protein n=1 Tax=Roseimaritima ulvae TaxID=980254 RepID=A0A5B9QT30_9BACT|nr:hypothetical protein [Roseimaritima ulvae]QEG42168.1 hypothetical protein UC8_42020 [Roseimaritima ulvae]